MTRLPLRMLAVSPAVLGVAVLPATLAGEPPTLGVSAPAHPDVVLDAKTGAVIEVESGTTVVLDPMTGEVVAFLSSAK